MHNISFIKEAWRKGRTFKEFATNLETINENNKACEFVAKNPATLGYFLTLEPGKLAKTLESIKDQNLASILGKSYRSIKEANDIDISDLDTRLRLAYVNQVSPLQPGESLKSLLGSSGARLDERSRQRNDTTVKGPAR